MSARRLAHCRVCGRNEFTPWLNLGEQPLANALRKPDDTSPEPTYELKVVRCDFCGLSQLTVIVDPDELYQGYRFRAGASPLWVNHCEALAELAADGREPGFVIDIAANDGTQLRSFKDRGWLTLGVDPAPCAPSDIPMYTGYWGPKAASEIRQVFQKADLVIAQNVLGHVDDVDAFFRGLNVVVKPEGLVCIEVPHVQDLVEKLAFDTVYHEHLSYWSRNPLSMLAHRHGFRVFKVQYIPTHGGSRRYWLARGRVQGAFASRPTDDSVDYAGFGDAVYLAVDRCREALQDMYRNGLEGVWGYGASAKATVFLNHVGIYLPERVVDDCEAKHGLLMPGVHIPIHPADDFTGCDVLWLLSWNNAPALKKKARERGFTGKFFTALPAPKLED